MRSPVPVTIRTSALPLAHPGRPTISWITAARFGDRWSDVTRPGRRPRRRRPVHGRRRARPARDVARRRGERPRTVGRSPAKVTLVAAVDTSSTWNCTHAAVTVAPGGRVTPVNRIAVICGRAGVRAQVQVTAGHDDRPGGDAFLGVVGAGPHPHVQHEGPRRIGDGDRHLVADGQGTIVAGQPQHVAPGRAERRRRRRGVCIREGHGARAADLRPRRGHQRRRVGQAVVGHRAGQFRRAPGGSPRRRPRHSPPARRWSARERRRSPSP